MEATCSQWSRNDSTKKMPEERSITWVRTNFLISSLKSVWPWSTVTTRRFSTEIWNHKTFSWQKKELSNLVISVLQECSPTLDQKPRLLWAHHTICLLKSSRARATVSNLIFGPWESCSMRWLPSSLHSMQSHFMSSQSGFAKASTHPYLPISHQQSVA